ncbi:hypothetical protein GCM10011360_02950 [Primorskyibacter flagellatus]|uniref:PH domain-containing protein n=1 Tax=Primorskyibacter flagellatus TaxID=1387277 RepID=A0A916ZX28_9RHOB|nr:hypothetical protein [Primorskyibacter flagellatus]GGE17541.1 hypothetical protein GCM10011360_02950 [Primorskyibacter flagellatus]
MTRAPALLPDERVIARRPRGLKPLLTGIALTGLAGVVIFAAVSWAATGTVRERGLVEFLVIFTALNAVLHPLARRRMDYCLTDRRLLIGPDRAIPLEDIAGFAVGPHSLTVTDRASHSYRIMALRRPAWLATRLNRCRAGGAPETGTCAS